MSELDSKKLEVTKKYLEKKEKIDDLKETQGSFLGIMCVFAIAIAPTAFALKLYVLFAALIVCVLPAGICLVSQLEINSLKKQCIGNKMSLKEFNKFVKSEEFNLCVEHLENKKVENVECVENEDIEENYVDVLKEYSYYDDQTLNVYKEKVSKENKNSNNNRR